MRDAFAGHGHDVWGVACIALGLLLGLGVYVDLAGPLGRGLAEVAGLLVGDLRVILPVVLVVTGIVLLRGPREEVTERRMTARRVAVGTVLGLLAIAGLLHLAQGRPEFGAPRADFLAAGGYIGAALGVPLERALAVVGAALVLAALVVVALVVATGVTVRTAARRTADGMRPVQSAVRRSVGSLFELDETGRAGGAGALDDSPVPILYDGTVLDDGTVVDDGEPMLTELVDPDGEPIDAFDDSELLFV
ncbi:MAG: DNA translocase FtsK 4TM domain-containing protein, partial [Acidimicrobiia bacterium]